ncbi:phage/plasmid primase, P4 family [Aurantimonas sp. A2-1-M11]|uniref:DNA primase family protein n=1 Tax=Aurantimonas sp. A2-1-M11 TaxID=3113712 RepID=UPI002F91F06F
MTSVSSQSGLEAVRAALAAAERQREAAGFGPQNNPVPGSTLIVFDGGRGGSSVPEGIPSDAVLAKDNAELETNDRDNAIRFLRRHPFELINVYGRGWYSWNGRFYEYDGDSARAYQLAGTVAAKIHDEAAHLKEKDKKAKARLQAKRHTFATMSGNHRGQTNMLLQVATRRQRDVNDLDQHRHRFIARNGTLTFVQSADDPGAWQSVFVAGHDPDDLATRSVEADYRPDAECPKWRAFLEQVQPDLERRLFLQRWAGLQLLGVMSHQAIVVHYGLGANGKSTYAKAIANVLGGYGVTVASETLISRTQREGNKPSPDLVRLIGVRSVQVHEYPDNEPLNEGMVKTMTGGETLPVHDKNKPIVELHPLFKLEVYANEKPPIKGSAKGIWRRLHLVDWSVTIPEASQRPMDQLLEEFKSESSGVLNWLIDGASMFLEDGLKPPASVRAAVEEYRDDYDHVGVFIRDCVRPEPGQNVGATYLYEAYTRWCKENAIDPYRNKSFSLKAVAHGLRKYHSNGIKYQDIKLHNIPASSGGNPPSPPYSEPF